MITDLKPYPRMKDSGVPWLGEVPSHWTLLPGRACYREKKVPNKGLTETTVLSLSYGHIVVKPPEKLHGLVPASFETYQIVEPEDIIVRPTDLQNDWNSLRFGLSRDRGVITSAYICLCTKEVATRPYGYLLLHTYDLKKVFYGLGSGLRQNLDWTDFKHLPCIVPPLPEQTAIVRFLDDADRRIRRYIRAKQKLIGLLEEQKQAIIREAVTGQIDVSTGRPYPAYKDSGVRWLGKVPEHWEVVQLRRVAVDRCDGPFGSGLKSLHYTRHGIRVVRLQNIGHGEFKSSDVACISPEHYSSLGDHSVMPGDILVAGLGDDNHPAGRACVAPENIAPAMVKADCFRFRPDRHRVEPRFVALQLTSTAATASALLSTGATRQRTNLQSTSSRAITIPTIHEQSLVVEYSALETSTIRSAQETAIKEMVYLREYRTRLTADVVTGKLDVREAAARLPEADPLADEDVVEAVHIDVDSNPEEREAAQEVSL